MQLFLMPFQLLFGSAELIGFFRVPLNPLVSFFRDILPFDEEIVQAAAELGELGVRLSQPPPGLLLLRSKFFPQPLAILQATRGKVPFAWGERV
jgi:hypothetical protein